MTTRVHFIHGLEGSPSGSKARLLARRFDAVTPAMDTSDFEGCVAQHAALLTEGRGPDVLAGSSFGGAVAVALLQRGHWAGADPAPRPGGLALRPSGGAAARGPGVDSRTGAGTTWCRRSTAAASRRAVIPSSSGSSRWRTTTPSTRAWRTVPSSIGSAGSRRVGSAGRGGPLTRIRGPNRDPRPALRPRPSTPPFGLDLRRGRPAPGPGPARAAIPACCVHFASRRTMVKTGRCGLRRVEGPRLRPVVSRARSRLESRAWRSATNPPVCATTWPPPMPATGGASPAPARAGAGRSASPSPARRGTPPAAHTAAACGPLFRPSPWRACTTLPPATPAGCPLPPWTPSTASSTTRAA